MHKIRTIVGVVSIFFVAACVAGGNTSKEVKVEQKQVSNEYRSIVPVASSSCVLSSASSSSTTSPSDAKNEGRVLEGYFPKVVAPPATSGILRYVSAVASSGILKATDVEGVKIKLSEAELKTLKAQFDDKCVVPGNSGKLIRFDYEHIFNASNKEGGHVGHYDPNCRFSAAQKKASPSVFPRRWEPKKIMSQISKAYTHRSISNQGKLDGDDWVVEVENLQGLKLRLVFELDSEGQITGKVKTVYPIK